jgi:hypothetical protein
MKRFKLRLTLPPWLIATALFATPSLAAVAQAPNTAAADIDTAAINALNRMGAYLRGLRSFEVKAATTKENVLDDGLKIQHAATADILARKPDRLRAELNGDDQQRLYVYDGSTFSIFAQRLGYYAMAPAPGTIGQLIDVLQDKYGIEMPLADLFYWGTEDAKIREITIAKDLGPTQVEGTTVQQYAFRQNGLDWQIWIQNGENPLPRKLVLTTTTDDSRPQYSAVMTWNLAPSFNDAAFVFNPPDGAKKIILADVNVPLGKQLGSSTLKK